MNTFPDHQINVLIVEDNEDDLFFIKKALDVKRYNLIVFISGIEAYQYLLKPTIKPDIVLLDNKLPGMDGIEILEKICKETNDYSFIFLTIDSSIKTVLEAMKAGALDFIVKSMDLKNELPEKIEKVYGIHQNKIERKRIEEELLKAKEKAEENENKYKNLSIELNKAQSVAKVGSWYWYIQEDRLVWSAEMYNIFGISQSNFSGNLSEVIQQSIHPLDKAKVKASNDLVIENGTPIPLEYRIVLPDGTIKVVWAEAGELIKDKDSKPLILSGIVQDITERKHTEEKLQEATKNWQTTFDAIEDIIILLSPDHSILEINKAGLISLDKTKDEVIGQKCYQMLHNTNAPIKNCPCDISFHEKNVVVNEYSQNNRIYELTAWPVFDENENVKAFTHVVKDITVKKHSEEALQKSQTILEEAQRIAKIGSWEWDMISNTVHWSKEMYLVYDIDPDTYDFKPESLIKVIHPDDVEMFTKSMDNNLGKGNSPALEYRVVHRDGSVHVIFAQGNVQFDKEGKPIRSLGTAQDITELKIIQQELIKAKEDAEENERKYKLIFDSAGTANSIFDTNCKLILQNKLSKEFLGFGEKGGTGLTVFEVFGQQAGKIVYERMQKVIKTGISEVFETEFSLMPGKNWFKSTYQPVFDENKNVISVQIISQNITEIKKAEQEIKRAFDIVQNIQTGLYIYHLENLEDDRTLKMVFANPASAQNTGVSSENIIGNTLDENFPHLRAKGIPQKFAEVVRTGKLLYIDDIYYGDNRVKNAYFVIKAFPLPDNHVGVAFDNITERKYAEEALLQSEDNYRRFMDESTLGIRIITKTGTTIYINNSLLQIYGLSNLQEFQKTPVVKRYTDAEYKRHKERKEKRKMGVDLTSEYEIDIISKKGEIRHVQVMRKEIIWDNSLHFQIIYQDITERKKVEEALRIAKERAVESEQLKTAFLHNMSHEIRTPMNAICGFANMLNKPNLSDEKRKSFTSIIVNNSNQLLSIVTDILIISSVETKQEKINIQKVCINNIIIDLLAIYKPQAFNQNISLFAKQGLTDHESEIYTDRTKLIQILTNLITNALKFTHQGNIEFGYELTVETNGRSSILPSIKFFVKDTGIGIKQELLEKIFERFRQADLSITKKYGGTGLGLSISKGFVELLGGSIWVESEHGNGSTFYFSFPYKPVHEPVKIQGNHQKNKTTILIAEDEEYNYLYIEELLIDMNLKLIHAKDGNEVVEICMANNDIGLILMDIKMPNFDGHGAAKKIKQLFPKIHIIAQSAYALEHEIKKFKDSAFDDYITKPIDEVVLKQKVINYLENKA